MNQKKPPINSYVSPTKDFSNLGLKSKSEASTPTFWNHLPDSNGTKPPLGKLDFLMKNSRIGAKSDVKLYKSGSEYLSARNGSPERPSISSLYLKNFEEIRKNKSLTSRQSLSPTRLVTANNECDLSVEEEEKIKPVQSMDTSAFAHKHEILTAREVYTVKKEHTYSSESLTSLTERSTRLSEYKAPSPKSTPPQEKIEPSPLLPRCLSCYEPILENQRFRLSACKHDFHLNCVKKSLKTKIQLNDYILCCPVNGCNALIPSDELCKCLEMTFVKN
jgi:hypothetical protein